MIDHEGDHGVNRYNVDHEGDHGGEWPWKWSWWCWPWRWSWWWYKCDHEGDHGGDDHEDNHGVNSYDVDDKDHEFMIMVNKVNN